MAMFHSFMKICSYIVIQYKPGGLHLTSLPIEDPIFKYWTCICFPTFRRLKMFQVMLCLIYLVMSKAYVVGMQKWPASTHCQGIMYHYQL